MLIPFSQFHSISAKISYFLQKRKRTTNIKIFVACKSISFISFCQKTPVSYYSSLLLSTVNAKFPTQTKTVLLNVTLTDLEDRGRGIPFNPLRDLYGKYWQDCRQYHTAIVVCLLPVGSCTEPPRPTPLRSLSNKQVSVWMLVMWISLDLFPYSHPDHHCISVFVTHTFTSTCLVKRVSNIKNIKCLNYLITDSFIHICNWLKK